MRRRRARKSAKPRRQRNGAVVRNALFGLTFIPGIVWFLAKAALFLFFYIWLRTTLPRIRYDRLMDFGWKVLLPVATLNLVVTAVVISFLGSQG